MQNDAFILFQLKFILFQVILVSVLVNYNPIENQCNDGARGKYALRERLFTIYKDSTSSKEIQSQESYKDPVDFICLNKIPFHCCCLWRSFTLRRSFLELQDRSSLPLSYQTHLRAARGAAHERPFLLGVHHCHWLLIYLNTKQRREIQIRGASRIKTRSHYVTDVSCASDSQLRGS